MERNPMGKVFYYKGYLVEYTGIPDEKNPLGMFFDGSCDAWHIIISGSISPFLAEAVAECIINEDNEGLKAILEKQGLPVEQNLEKKQQESNQLEIELAPTVKAEILEILQKKRF